MFQVPKGYAYLALMAGSLTPDLFLSKGFIRFLLLVASLYLSKKISLFYSIAITGEMP